MEIKTKVNYSIGVIISTLFFGILSTNANLTVADGLTPLTAGLMDSFYEVEWCSPHAGKLSDTRFNSGDCQKGYFNNVGGVGKMTYKGENFSNGNVALNKVFPSTTRTSTTNFIDFFSGISKVEFEGEGTYKVRILLVDYAYNAAKFEFTYKIDKTAPQFQLTGITDTDNSPFVYVDSSPRNTGIDLNGLKKFDSVVNNSDKDTGKYDNPMVQNYSGDIPVEKSNHERINLYSVYYKDDGLNFSLNTLISDTFENYLKNYTSGLDKVELLKGDHTFVSNLTLGSTLLIDTSKLGLLPNSQGKFIVRVYDKTTGKSGVNGEKANYSEIVFYAVRDNTAPNMGEGLASTKKEAIKKLLGFNNTTHVWDDNVSSFDNSKFIAANSAQQLISILNDTGIGSDVSNPGWYNAGVPLGGGTKITIEKPSSVNEFQDVITYDNRFENNISKTHSFSMVDNNRKNGYRKYKTQFNTTGISGNDRICDNVGNCLDPKVDFRVVANVFSETNSNLDIGLNSDTGGGKIFANGKDKYNFEANLKDTYGNKIVGVTAVENGDKKIKSVDIAFNYQNGLNKNQLDNSGDKLVNVTDLLSSKNKPSSNISGININGKLYFAEKEEVGKDNTLGSYKYTLGSLVPSNTAYPYLKDDSVLKLNSIDPKAISSTSGVGTYGDIGIFNTTINSAGNTKLITSNIDFLSNSDYRNDLNETKKDNYGQVTLSQSNIDYQDFRTNYSLDFPYASPFIYGAENLSLNHLIANIGQSKSHNKKVFNFSSDLNNTKIFEQYLPSYTGTTNSPKYTPGIFNIFSTISGSALENTDIINSGTTINGDAIGSNRGYITKSSPIKSNYQIAGYGFNMGYISSVDYTIGTDTVKLPSISRNISDTAGGDAETLKKESRFYFPTNNYVGNGDYVILGDPIISAGLLSGMGIAITGLSNNEDLMIVDKDKGRKANLNVGENLTRYDMITIFKQNIEKYSAGLGNGNTKKWCNGVTINNLNTGLDDCTIDIKGEKISFIKGNVDISCNTDNTCVLNDNLKRTIIVKDGSTYIKSNINTFGKNSQLLIGTINDSGLKNISIPTGDNPIIARDTKVNGWTFIDPSVTNIDAFIVSQGPMISYHNGTIYNAPGETELKNQLHIYGSTLSLNTIGGYKSDDDSKCPYIISKSNCDQKTAFIFDLVTIRRYSLVGEGPGSTNFIPSGNGLRSGRNDSAIQTSLLENQVIIDNADTSGKNGLRFIKDKDYIVYPLLVERDTLWNKSPSIMSKTQN